MTFRATTRFEAFGSEHLVLLAIFAVGLAFFVALGRRHRGTPAEEPFRRGTAVALAAVGLGMQAYQLTPDDFALGTSLPLQLCDVATVAAVVALWSRSWRAAGFVYYVGLTLTLQAVLTPSLAEAFPHPRYFGFWALHFLVVWTAAYLTWGLGIRPTWRSYRFTVAATLVWAVVTFTFNVVVDTNYGYLNGKPASASLLDFFGPWPLYLVVVMAILWSAWALLMTWPWQRSGRQRSGGRTAEGGPDRTDGTPHPPTRWFGTRLRRGRGATLSPHGTSGQGERQHSQSVPPKR